MDEDWWRQRIIRPKDIHDKTLRQNAVVLDALQDRAFCKIAL